MGLEALRLQQREARTRWAGDWLPRKLASAEMVGPDDWVRPNLGPDRPGPTGLSTLDQLEATLRSAGFVELSSGSTYPYGPMGTGILHARNKGDPSPQARCRCRHHRPVPRARVAGRE